MACNDDIILVEALYSFKGKNNDELCFNKGDIITVTQREDGGWWEGTLNDKTGWFPSNYTKECRIQDGPPGSPLHAESQLLSPNHSQQQQIYKLTIVKEIIDSEKNHLAELQTLLGGHLCELRKADILLEAEYNQLVGNLEDVCFCHNLLVKSLEEQLERPSREQRIGGVFLQLAPRLQGVHKAYCSNHPKAVCMLEKYKDELSSFMEREGAIRPGIMVLTTALSKPFRRLDKYAGMLQEYERHLEEGHADRGDTQRSSHVYKDLASSCSAIRRQKELELEVVAGRVHGWDGGESLVALGEVMRMGSVALLPDHRDRYLVLFPTTLVMLSVSPRMSAFIFEGNYALQSIHVTKLEDNDHYKNAFEMTGPLAERIIAICQTKEDQMQWVEVLSQQSRLARSTNYTPHKPSLTSSHVASSHVSDFPWVGEALLPTSSRYLCMNCGLPYLMNDSSSMWDRGGGHDNSRHLLEEEYNESEISQFKWCACNIPDLTPITQSTPAISGGKLYTGRPYAVLTKFFCNMYRRKIINKKLLRYLSGDQHDDAQAQMVTLRRHKTECSILTGYSSSDDSGDEDSNGKTKDRALSGSSETSESSTDEGGGVWIDTKLKFGATAVAAPPSKVKGIATGRAASSLQKWRYHGKELRASASSSESGVSTDGSNPYGYVRYYNPEDSTLETFKSNEVQPYAEIPLGIATKLKSQDCTDSKKGCKSVSSNDSFYSVSHEMPLGTSLGAVSEWNKAPYHHYPRLDIEEESTWGDLQRSCSCNVKGRTSDSFETSCVCPDETCKVSNSKSYPIFSSNESTRFRENTYLEGKTVHSSILNIPANPIILPNVPPLAYSDDFSDSTPNICNKTIYESSSSTEGDLMNDKLCPEANTFKKVDFPFKTKPDVAYYVSSCSGDEMGNDGGDYYENQRKQTPGSMTVSHSEPNLCLASPHLKCELEKVKFSSHFVQLVCDVENPGKVCRCESFSHRSSDSGLADIVHHLEFCPLRSETPGVGRGSCLSHCSHSSHMSGVKLSRCESSCHVRPFSPDFSGDNDSLLPTPLTTPCASNPVSYTTDSITSLYESSGLRFSPSAQHPILCTTFSENREESVFRSGLYAHWWMKASVCPKLLTVERLKKDYLRFKADKKPDVPPKPKFLKPSYHIKRGGLSGAVVKPISKSASTQTGLSQSQNVRILLHPHKSLPGTCNTDATQATDSQLSPLVNTKKQSMPSHLSIHDSPSIPRDPSFESQSSQVSQITVIPKLHYQNLELATEFQEQLSVPNKQCLSAMGPHLKNSQESSGTSNNSCYELCSLNSFNECCNKDDSLSHLRDSSEGLDVDFHRRASSQSLCTGVGDSATFTSSVYCELQPIQSVSVHSGLVECDRVVPSGVSGTRCKTGKCKPSLPPKPQSLMSWPLQRSKSLPKLPVSSFSTHSKSKSSMMPRQASISSVTSNSESPVKHCRSPGGKVWSMSCLKPSPPLRPGLSNRDEKKGQKHGKRRDDKWHEDDALILRVIEAYCTSAKTRHTVNSIDLGQVSRSCGGGGLDCRGGIGGTPQHHPPPNSPPPLSPFGDLRLNKGQRSNWCCGLAIKAIKKNIDFDC